MPVGQLLLVISAVSIVSALIVREVCIASKPEHRDTLQKIAVAFAYLALACWCGLLGAVYLRW